jgi:hypothetical protein
MGTVPARCEGTQRTRHRLDWSTYIMSRLSRLRRTVGNLVAEDRPGFKRVDASPARYDDGSWLK